MEQQVKAQVEQGNAYEAMELAKSKVQRLRRAGDAERACALAIRCCSLLQEHADLAQSVLEPAMISCEEQCHTSAAAQLGGHAPAAVLLRWSQPREHNDTSAVLLRAAIFAHARSVLPAERDLVLARALLVCLLRRNVSAIQKLSEHLPQSAVARGSAMFAEAAMNGWLSTASMVASTYSSSFQRDPQLHRIVNVMLERLGLQPQ